MDREKAIDEAKFSFGELREALVERHSEETQQKLERGRVAIAGLGLSAKREATFQCLLF